MKSPHRLSIADKAFTISMSGCKPPDALFRMDTQKTYLSPRDKRGTEFIAKIRPLSPSSPQEMETLMIRDIRYIITRKYSDYLNCVKTHRGISRIEYDSVIGKINDFQAILTITFVKYDFQFGLLIKKNDSLRSSMF